MKKLEENVIPGIVQSSIDSWGKEYDTAVNLSKRLARIRPEAKLPEDITVHNPKNRSKEESINKIIG